MRRPGSAVLLFAATLLPAVLAAQRDTEPPAHWCYRGRPAPRCRAFVLTEFGASFPIADNGQTKGPLYTWELGVMANRGTRHAFGAALFAQARDEVTAAGIRPRARVWLSGSTSVDLAPGLVLTGSSPGPGFSGLATVNFGDLAAVSTEVMVLRPRPVDLGQGTRVSLFVGGRLGSGLGATAIVGTGALILAFLISCSGGCFSD